MVVEWELEEMTGRNSTSFVMEWTSTKDKQWWDSKRIRSFLSCSSLSPWQNVLWLHQWNGESSVGDRSWWKKSIMKKYFIEIIILSTHWCGPKIIVEFIVAVLLLWCMLMDAHRRLLTQLQSPFERQFRTKFIICQQFTLQKESFLLFTVSEGNFQENLRVLLKVEINFHFM